MKLLSVVVTYFPDIPDLKKNIDTYLCDVDQVIFWENTPKDKIKYSKEDFSNENGKLIFLGESRNVGIGRALNKAAEYAVKNGFSHLLTMDQDSFFEEGMLQRFKARLSENDYPGIGVFGVNYISGDKLAYDHHPYNILKVNECITSGSIYPVDLFENGIFFNEEMFIDAVDFEYCYRVKNDHGKETVLFTDIFLQHKLGYSDSSFFGKWSSSYSAFRTFYLLKNQLHVWRKYPRLFENKRKKHFVIHYVIIRLFAIIIHENDKKRKLHSFFKGLYKGLFDKIN